MASEHDYHIAAEKDFSGKVNRHIWYVFIGLGVGLFLTMFGLDIMYRFLVDTEKREKIGEVTTHEATAEIARCQSYLSGEKGLLPGKRHVSIDVAMARFLSDMRQAR